MCWAREEGWATEEGQAREGLMAGQEAAQATDWVGEQACVAREAWPGERRGLSEGKAGRGRKGWARERWLDKRDRGSKGKRTCAAR